MLRFSQVSHTLNIHELHLISSYLDILVLEGFLVREIGTPSSASSLPSSEENNAIWLVEPRRTKSVRKFSGTMAHPNRRDKIGITLSAFTHFAYELSHKELVFADVQGLPPICFQFTSGLR